MKNFRKILFIVAFIVISAVLPCIMGNVNAVAYQSVIAEEIQDNKIVNSSSNDDYLFDPTKTYITSLQDSYLYQKSRALTNCYAYAIEKEDEVKSYQPGDFSNNTYDLETVTVAELADIIKKDLECLGKQNVVISTSCPNVNTSNRKIICVRKGYNPTINIYDYHLMKCNNGLWYHKPGSTSILQYKYAPSSYRDWINEYYDDIAKGCYKTDMVYSGDIYFISYYPENYNAITDTCDITTYDQLANDMRYNTAANFKLKLMASIVAPDEVIVESGVSRTVIWEYPKEFYGSFNGNGFRIENLKYTATFADLDENIVETKGFVNINYGTISNVAFGDIEIKINDDVSETYYTEYNIGIVACVNEGTIEDCMIGTTVIDGEIHMSSTIETNIGGVCGINNGTIDDCMVSYTYITGFDNLGNIAGCNYGMIKNCLINNSELKLYYGSVGGIAGYNEGYIVDNSISFCVISCLNDYSNNVDGTCYQYADEPINAYAGSFVGWNADGEIKSCTTVGCTVKCNSSSITGEKGRSFAPEIGRMCGRAAEEHLNANKNIDTIVDKGNLHIEKWKGGFLNLVTYSWNQTQFCGDRDIGRIL